MLAVTQAAIRTSGGRNALQLAGLGGALLVLGGLFYLLVRPVGFGAQWLGAAPTLLHVVALSLLMGATTAPGRRGAIVICATWVGVNALFELGQAPAAAAAISNWLGVHCDAFACRRSAQFFLRGTFDVLDLVAALLGGGIAWRLLRAATVPVRA